MMTMVARTARTMCYAALLLTGAARMSQGEGSEVAGLKTCTSNMQELYKLIRIHGHHSGGVVPIDLETLYLMARRQDFFVCPLDAHPERSKSGEFSTSYAVVSRLKRVPSDVVPKSIAILYEISGNHEGSRLVLFYDGSSVLYSEAEFQELRKNSFIRK